MSTIVTETNGYAAKFTDTQGSNKTMNLCS
jgi:hypothetical protein